MKVTSPYKPHEVSKILYEQVDQLPSVLRCLLSLNAHYFVGTSSVCGDVGESEFELRNRKGPYFSLRVKGELTENSSGTDIELSFLKPFFPDILGFLVNRYKRDKQVVFDFLREWIKINCNAEQEGWS